MKILKTHPLVILLYVIFYSIGTHMAYYNIYLMQDKELGLWLTFGILPALILYFVLLIRWVVKFIQNNNYLCLHRWVSCGERVFGEPKMDDNGKLSTRMQLQVCEKCGKLKHISI